MEFESRPVSTIKELIMKFSIGLAASVAALIVSGGVSAADLGSRGGSLKDDGVYSEKSWTGLWLGAFGGYGISNTELGLDHVYTYGDGGRENLGKVNGLGGEGLFGEVQLGLDKQIGRLVIGVYGIAGLSASETTFHAEGSEIGSIEEKFSWGGALRIGALLNKNNMAYIAGGYREVEVDINFAGSPTVEETFTGFFGEAGLESRLTDVSDNAYLRIAARYTAFNDKTWSNRGVDDNCWEELNADPGKLEVMVGISYKLGSVASPF